MGENTKISWANHTFNPWIGCTKVSPACDHCYAERLAKRMQVKWGAGEARRRTKPRNWAEPLKWDRQAEAEGVRYRVFAASLADVFDNEVPVEWRVNLFDLIRQTPHLDWLLLTKRIGAVTRLLENAREHAAWSVLAGKANHALDKWLWEWRNGNPPANVWLGATVVNQAEADRDVPKLLNTPAAVRFLSIEPMLGAIDLRPHMNRVDGTAVDPYCDDCGERHEGACDGLDWIIAGGESGPHARPSHPDWFRSLRDQCVEAGVPFLFKQWGEWAPWRCGGFGDDRALGEGNGPWPYGRGKFADWVLPVEGISPPNFTPFMEYPHGVPTGCTIAARLGKKAAGRMLDGRTWDQFPQERRP